MATKTPRTEQIEFERMRNRMDARRGDAIRAALDALNEASDEDLIANADGITRLIARMPERILRGAAGTPASIARSK
jgi:hypothetical protein